MDYLTEIGFEIYDSDIDEEVLPNAGDESDQVDEDETEEEQWLEDNAVQGEAVMDNVVQEEDTKEASIGQQDLAVYNILAVLH